MQHLSDESGSGLEEAEDFPQEALHHTHWLNASDTRLLTAAEEVELARQVRSGNLDARQRMVDGCLWDTNRRHDSCTE